MNAYSLILIFLILGIRAFGQPIERRTADSLLQALNKNPRGVERIELLLNLAQFHILKPGELEIDLDSAAIYINEAKALNKSVQSSTTYGYQLLTESYLASEKGHRDEAKDMLENAIGILESGNDKSYLGQAYFELSGYYSINDIEQLEERIRLMESALSCFQQTGNVERIGTCHYTLGDLYMVSNNDDPKALKHLRLSLAAFQSINHTAVQGVYILMGTFYTFQGDNKQALDNGLLALKTAENVGDTSLQLCQINNGIARTLVRLNERQKATHYFDRALEIAEKYKEPSSIYVVATNLAINWTALGDANKSLRILKYISTKYQKPQDPIVDFNTARSYIISYTRLKQYANAQPYCDHLLQVFDHESVSSFGRIEVYAVVINFYIASGQYDLAIKYLNKHKKLSEETTDLALTAANNRLWFVLDTTRHNYNSAVKHLLNYNRLNDSLFNETKSKQVAELQIQFETEKKEKDILIKDQQIGILTKEQEFKDMNLKRIRFTRNVTLCGSILLLMTGIVFFRQYRRKQRDSNTIARINQQLKDMLAEKEWWLKEVHHRVKNNLHTIICLLESQAMYLEKDALHAIEKSQHRIYAMSLIHQKLYQNEELRSIDMSLYLEEFIGYLKDSFDTSKIEFIVNVEPIHLNLQQAIPVGLIINEGVTNSIKYAFGNEAVPKIWISMTLTNEVVNLVISDNGKGFEMKVEDEGKSLGMQLIKGLGKELKGTVRIDSKGGTKLRVDFKRAPITERIVLLTEDKN
jgi:two-component sensor histidine kinase